MLKRITALLLAVMLLLLTACDTQKEHKLSAVFAASAVRYLYYIKKRAGKKAVSAGDCGLTNEKRHAIITYVMHRLLCN